MDKLYTPAEVSKRTGLSPERVRQYARTHSMMKFAGSYVWTEKDIQALESKRIQIGKKGRENENPEN